MNKLRKGMLFAAALAAVSVIVANGGVWKEEVSAETGSAVCAVVVKPQQKPVREDFLPEKTRSDRIALKAAMLCDDTVPEQKPVQSAVAEPVVEPESIPVKQVIAALILPAKEEPTPPSAPPPEPDLEPELEPSYSSNGWQPASAEHYHGTGTDSGTCPACGLLYGPAAGTEGQYTAQDGLMD